MLAAITCYFNPIEQNKIIENYWKFRDNLNVDLYTIELSSDGNFQIPDAFHLTNSVSLWHKERLLNVILEKVPEKYDKIAWLDADIIFSEDNWGEDADKMLDSFNIIQLFETIDGNPGVVSSGSDDPFVNEPGKAWAAKRDVIHKCGILDTFIMGGAEHMMFYALKGMFKNPKMNRFNLEWRRSYLEWAAVFYRNMQQKVSFLKGNILHLDHGSYADPDFADRWLLLSHNRYNPKLDIVDEGNSWTWLSGKRNMHAEIENYFIDRKNDELWIQELNKPEDSSGLLA